jgi:transposase-like protein
MFWPCAAKHIAPLLAGKLETATATESIGRSTAVFQSELAALQDKVQGAEAAIAQCQAEMCLSQPQRRCSIFQRPHCRSCKDEKTNMDSGGSKMKFIYDWRLVILAALICVAMWTYVFLR